VRTKRFSEMIVVAGILGIVSVGCSGSTSGDGEASSKGGGSAGETASGSGGNSNTESTASGGTRGSGGVTSEPVAGGTRWSSSGTPSGGAGQTGGTAASSGGRSSGTGGRSSGIGGRVGGAGGTTTEGSGGAVGSSGTGTGTAGRTSATSTAAGGSAGANTGTGGTSGGKAGNTGATTPGTCTASKAASANASGSGPHKVVVETNTGTGISCGTIYRPADLGGADKYPIFVWGEGGCSRNGLSNQASMAEIASYGYFVIADGPAGGGGSNCGSISMSNDVAGMAKVMIGYIDWAIAENGKSCSAYFGSLDTTKIASDGFSCGGLMSMGTAGDPRMTAVGLTSSGLTSSVASYYKTIHTPFKILVGGSGDVAYTNGMRDYDEMVKAGVKVLLLSKNNAGHGGDLSNGKGDFNTVNLAWLNWQLKGDEGATGKALLIGDSCKFCKASGWEFKSSGL
jgi:hypothetical protein